MDASQLIKSADVRRRFDAVADTFPGADFVHSVTRDGLFARLEPMVVDAAIVVDLGCAAGAAIGPLAKRFRKARIVGVDVSRNMLLCAQSRRRWFTKDAYLQADARTLPFSDQSVDVVFCNLLLPWIDDAAVLAGEVARVLRKDGLFLFSTLGPDSLLELRRAWAAVDARSHVNRFLDMHDVGDALVRSGLRDPVLDVDRLAVSFGTTDALFADLRAAGARNCLASRQKSLTGKRAFEAMRKRLEGPGETAGVRLDLELVYGHCWGSGAREPAGDVRIDATAIPRRRR